MIVFVGLLRTRCSYSLKLMPVRLSIAELRLPNIIFLFFPYALRVGSAMDGGCRHNFFFFQNFKFSGYHIPSINATTTSFTTAANDMACWAIGHIHKVDERIPYVFFFFSLITMDFDVISSGLLY